MFFNKTKTLSNSNNGLCFNFQCINTSSLALLLAITLGVCKIRVKNSYFPAISPYSEMK